ncbi:MAG: methyltransferase domain-containing protein [Myxococcota bacterium]|jgi:SAM-dependent methyltransferase
MSDVSDAGFWEARYHSSQTGWEKGRCAPPIVRMLKEGFLTKGAHVAVLGAGRGHEALEAAALGFEATAVDFAEPAIEATLVAAGQRKLDVETLLQDVFTLGATHEATFDAVLEHTCFCAIDPARRDEYVEVVHRVLKPGGVFFGLFFAHGRPGGPPFDTSEAEVRRRFEPRFVVERLVRAKDSFADRAGEELEFIFRRKG